MLKAEGGRSCIFCGAAEVTDEHVWPEWISRVLEKAMPEANFMKARVQTDPVSLEESQIGEAWGGPGLALTVKRVCATCNSQWMSTLENEAKPYLEPMILGHQVPLDKQACGLVAAWAFLRIVMAEYTHPAFGVAVSDAHRRWLFGDRKPPPNGVFIWLAGYMGDKWVGYYKHVPLAVRRGDIGAGYRPSHRNGYGVTFSIHKLVFQVFGVTTAISGGDLRHSGPLAEATHRIWPPDSESETTVLPKLIQFGDDQLRDFSNIFVTAAS